MVLKQVKEILKERCLNINTILHTKTLENASNVRNYVSHGACYIVKNIPKPKFILNGSMVNASTE